MSLFRAVMITTAVIAAVGGTTRIFGTTDAALASVAMMVPSGVMFLVALRARHVALATFAGLTFLSLGIGGAFFYLNRESYGPAGWAAVGDFDFSLRRYLPMVSYVTVFMVMLTVMTLALSAVLLRFARPISIVARGKSANTPHARGNSRPVYPLVLVISAIGVPLNLFMYSARVGMTGVDEQALPFHLVGVLFYVRLLVVPLLILVLHQRAKASVISDALIIAYGLLAGLCSLSRGVLLVSSASVPLKALRTRRPSVTLFVGAVLTITFVTASIGKAVFYEDPGMSFFRYLASLRSASQSIIAVAGSAADVLIARLGGPQSTILGIQYGHDLGVHDVMAYFSGRNPIQDMPEQLFGFSLPPEFGVAISYTGWVLLFANRRLWMLGLLALISAGILVLIEAGARLLARENDAATVIAVPCAIVAVIFLYSSMPVNAYGIGAVALLYGVTKPRLIRGLSVIALRN